jgi:hypothetical protein
LGGQIRIGAVAPTQELPEFLAGFPSVNREQVIEFLETAKAAR